MSELKLWESVSRGDWVYVSPLVEKYLNSLQSQKDTLITNGRRFFVSFSETDGLPVLKEIDAKDYRAADLSEELMIKVKVGVNKKIELRIKDPNEHRSKKELILGVALEKLESELQQASLPSEGGKTSPDGARLVGDGKLIGQSAAGASDVAFLSASVAEPFVNRVRGAKVRKLLREAADAAELNEALGFVLSVYDATQETVTLVVDTKTFSIKEFGKEIIISAFGREIFQGDGQSIHRKAMENGLVEVTLSMSDLKLFLTKAYTAADKFELDQVITKAVGVIDLDDLAANPDTAADDLSAIAIPVLVREAVSFHNSPSGEKSVFLIRSKNPAVLGAVNAELAKLEEKHDFIVTDEAQIPSDYQDVPRALFTSRNAWVPKGGVSLFLQKIAKGDVPNFHGGFKAGFAFARVDELLPTDPAVIELHRLMEALLGHKVPIDTLLGVIQGRIADPEIRELVTLGYIVRIPVDKIVQGARLVTTVMGRAA